MAKKPKPSADRRLPVAVEMMERGIYLIRGQKVMLSTHLAELYQVEPRALVQTVKRNIERVPEDFIFRPTRAEFDNLKSQFVTLRHLRLSRASGCCPSAPQRSFWAVSARRIRRLIWFIRNRVIYSPEPSFCGFCFRRISKKVHQKLVHPIEECPNKAIYRYHDQSL